MKDSRCINPRMLRPAGQKTSHNRGGMIVLSSESDLISNHVALKEVLSPRGLSRGAELLVLGVNKRQGREDFSLRIRQGD